MSNFILDNTASDINTALGKVLNLDTSPTNTDALITSGGVKTYVDTAVNLAYPIGSIYLNATNSSNPSTLMGFGTWVEFGSGRVPVGIDLNQSEFNTPEKEGGAKTHTLTLNQIPAHSHSLGYFGNNSHSGQFKASSSVTNQTVKGTETAGGGQSHNNLQPYIVVYMWKRTA